MEVKVYLRGLFNVRTHNDVEAVSTADHRLILTHTNDRITIYSWYNVQRIEMPAPNE